MAARESGHNKNKAEEACSPFFACATCPGFVELSGPIQILHPVAIKQVHHERLESFSLYTFLNSCWQPPRV